jgi:hypothetical protein
MPRIHRLNQPSPIPDWAPVEGQPEKATASIWVRCMQLACPSRYPVTFLADSMYRTCTVLRVGTLHCCCSRRQLFFPSAPASTIVSLSPQQLRRRDSLAALTSACHHVTCTTANPTHQSHRLLSQPPTRLLQSSPTLCASHCRNHIHWQSAPDSLFQGNLSCPLGTPAVGCMYPSAWVFLNIWSSGLYVHDAPPEVDGLANVAATMSGKAIVASAYTCHGQSCAEPLGHSQKQFLL